ncbi:DUF6896 domain-containing protein [Allocatelliglobosispora scoriae]|uniref:DUF6896 domain-containing protein n=1 Tax=Allocatelliglobosispora scoriae TaxID=643052 RepID=UPI0035E42C3A
MHFAHAAARFRGWRQYGRSDGGADLASLHRAVIQRRAGRKWQLPSGVHYSVHDSGCYIKGKDGAVIDIDIAADGQTLVSTLIEFFGSRSRYVLGGIRW